MDDLDIYRLDRSGWPGAWDVDSIFALIVILTLWGYRKRELLILAITQIRVRLLGLLALLALVALACSCASPPATAPLVLVLEAAPARVCAPNGHPERARRRCPCAQCHAPDAGPAMESDFCATDKKSDPRWWLTIDGGVPDPDKGQDLCATGYCP
jgi:hypothetical protein